MQFAVIFKTTDELTELKILRFLKHIGRDLSHLQVASLLVFGQLGQISYSETLDEKEPLHQQHCRPMVGGHRSDLSAG